MEFLLTLIVVLLVAGYLLRLLAPFILKWFVKRMQKKFEQQTGNNNTYYNQQNRNRQRPEGDVRVEQQQSQNKIIDRNMGDYVDFEDVN